MTVLMEWGSLTTWISFSALHSGEMVASMEQHLSSFLIRGSSAEGLKKRIWLGFAPSICRTRYRSMWTTRRKQHKRRVLSQFCPSSKLFLRSRTDKVLLRLIGMWPMKSMIALWKKNFTLLLDKASIWASSDHGKSFFTLILWRYTRRNCTVRRVTKEMRR